MMRALRALVGVIFVVCGVAAIGSSDLTEGGWWLLAVAAAITGIVGLVSAVTAPRV